MRLGFRTAVGENLEVTETPWMPENFDELTRDDKNPDPHIFGLYDGAAKKLYTLRLKNLDILKALEPEGGKTRRIVPRERLSFASEGFWNWYLTPSETGE